MIERTIRTVDANLEREVYLNDLVDLADEINNRFRDGREDEGFALLNDLNRETLFLYRQHGWVIRIQTQTVDWTEDRRQILQVVKMGFRIVTWHIFYQIKEV